MKTPRDGCLCASLCVNLPNSAHIPLQGRALTAWLSRLGDIRLLVHRLRARSNDFVIYLSRAELRGGKQSPKVECFHILERDSPSVDKKPPRLCPGNITPSEREHLYHQRQQVGNSARFPPLVYHHTFQSLPRIFTWANPRGVCCRKQHVTVAAALFHRMLARSFLLFFFLFFLFIDTELGRSHSAAVCFFPPGRSSPRWASGTAGPSSLLPRDRNEYQLVGSILVPASAKGNSCQFSI